MGLLRVEVNGIQLAYALEEAPAAAGGEPRARLLGLWGGPGADAPAADPLPCAAALREAVACIRLQLRGSGESEAGSPALLHLEQWAWDVRAFCAVLGIEHPVVLASAANAAVALLYAARNRRHPAGLVLSDPVWQPERVAAWASRDRPLDLAAELARVTCPTLLLASRPEQEASARALAKQLSQAPVAIERLPGCDPAAAQILAVGFAVGLELC